MTGKSGQYSYYRCSTKSYQAANLCTCPNVPREELESVVLNVLAEQVLQPARVVAMIEQLRARVLDARAQDRQREVGLRKQLNTATEQVNTWYALV